MISLDLRCVRVQIDRKIDISKFIRNWYILTMVLNFSGNFDEQLREASLLLYCYCTVTVIRNWIERSVFHGVRYFDRTPSIILEN